MEIGNSHLSNEMSFGLPARLAYGVQRSDETIPAADCLLVWKAIRALHNVVQLFLFYREGKCGSIESG
jgi:hypothetical protein